MQCIDFKKLTGLIFFQTLFFPSLYSQENAGDINIEANPFQLVNSGMELGMEFLNTERSYSANGFGLGFSMQNPYYFEPPGRDTINGTRDLIKLYYQWRYYFFDQSSGLFTGVKIVPTFSISKVTQGNYEAKENKFFAPLYFQLGYRFSLRELKNFSFSLFSSIGVYLGSPKISETLPKDVANATDSNAQANQTTWKYALTGMNEYYSKMATDYGFTIGYVF